MEKIGLIVDSTASLSKDYIKDNDIGVVRFKYSLDGKEYSEGLEESPEEFHLRLKESDDIPKTSQPTVSDYLEIYDQHSKRYDKVLVLPLSKGISGAYQTAVMASKDFEKVRVLDTCNALDSVRFMVEKIYRLMDDGMDAKEIGDTIERDRLYPNYSACLIANELKYLEKGGRIPKAIGSAGDFLRLKPIININAKDDGKLAVTEISRGNKRTINRIVELLPEDTKRVAVGDINNRETRDILEEKILERFPHIELTYATVTPVIASHIGPNCYGMFYAKI